MSFELYDPLTMKGTPRKARGRPGMPHTSRPNSFWFSLCSLYESGLPEKRWKSYRQFLRTQNVMSAGDCKTFGRKMKAFKEGCLPNDESYRNRDRSEKENRDIVEPKFAYLTKLCRDADLSLSEVLTFNDEDFRELSRNILEYNGLQHARVFREWRMAQKEGEEAGRGGGGGAAAVANAGNMPMLEIRLSGESGDASCISEDGKACGKDALGAKGRSTKVEIGEEYDEDEEDDDGGHCA